VREGRRGLMGMEDGSIETKSTGDQTKSDENEYFQRGRRGDDEER